MSFGEYKMIIPYFTGSSFRFDTTKKSITLLLNLAESSSSNSNSVSLTNVIYETISVSDLGDLTLQNIPDKPNETLKNVSARDKKQTFLFLYPIIKDGNSYKRIKSFSYSINNSSAKNSSSSLYQKAALVSNSVLASGDWYRFYVEKSGVYRISRSFLQSLGFDPGKVDPRRIKIYGNGGRMLPLANNTYYPDDLTENAIQIVGESDGTFNNDDYILFYAEGVDNWNTESQTNINVYDTRSYYYITTNGADGKRIANTIQPTGSSTLELNTFDDYQFHETDLTNIAHLGRQWLGEAFDINQEQEFEFNFPNLETSVPVKIEV
ncbi:peptidase C25, partial [Flavobacterium sp. LBUM151]